MPDNRRRFFRVRASLRFTFSWEGGFELYRTTDLSACGAAIQLTPELAARAPPVGTIGECAFNLESMEIRAVARVVRVSRGYFAVDFVALPRRQEDRICGWVFRQETRKPPG